MNKITVTIKRNAGYEKGMYGLSIHDQPGQAANVIPINSKDELRPRLIDLGLSAGYGQDIIERLTNRLDFVETQIEQP